jgi:hypothetical protein
MKYILLGAITIFANICQAQSKSDLSLTPWALQPEIEKCVNAKVNSPECQNIVLIANTINALVLEMQQSPQGYGLSILNLQMRIAEAMRQNQQTKDPALDAQIQQEKHELAMRLAIIRWLQSPGGQ